MIFCADSGFDGDVFVHRATASPELFRVGDVVAFTIHVNSQGKPQADTLWRLAGHLKGEPSFGELEGVLARVLEGGHGFLESDEIKDRYGRDVYVHRKVMEQCGLKKGDTVAFNVHVSEAGNPQASFPCWIRVALKGRQDIPQDRGDAWSSSKGRTEQPRTPPWASSKAGNRADTRSRSGDRRPQRGQQGSHGSSRVTPRSDKARSLEPVDGMPLPEGYHLGHVASVEATRGVSMVKCPASDFTNDVYVHQSVADPSALAVDDVVCFRVHVNKRGLPQASAPFWKQVGRDELDDRPSFGEFQGLVQRPESDGSATVESSEIVREYGREAYLPEEALKQCGLFEGNLIRFNVYAANKREPEVLAPCWICCSSPNLVRDLLGGATHARSTESDEAPPAKRARRSSRSPSRHVDPKGAEFR